MNQESDELPALGGVHPGRKRLATALGVAGSVTVLCLALWFLHRELAELSLQSVAAQVRSIPTTAVLTAVLFAACSYQALVAYDALALRYLRRKLPYLAYALTSFMAYAVGYNVGVATLSGGSIRYRLYSLRGLSATEVATIVVFVTLTFALGASALLGIALLVMPADQTAALNLSPGALSAAGCILVALPVAYVGLAVVRRKPFMIKDWRVTIPRSSVATLQIAVSAADIAFAAATLYVLLAPVLPIGFLPFLGIYLIAIAAGLISSVPGGVGVFEAVLVAGLPQVPRDALLGAIVVYRLIYYVAPLCLALLLLVAHEVRQHRRIILRATERIGNGLSGITPQVMATLVFVAGAVLLISGASPAVESRLRLIEQAIPLSLLELSHLLGSVVGVGLLVLARGLHQRLRSAYLATLVALAIGAAMSLLKGLDFEEALIMAAVGVALWLSRDEFHRLGSLGSQRYSAAWLGAVVFVLCIVLWVALVSFRDVAYSSELWWQFAFDADAPRTLRAGLVTAGLVLGFAFWKVLRAGPARDEFEPTASDLHKVRAVLAGCEDPSANVALVGDKRLLWSDDDEAFVMYQISGDSWIAMGDPVGPESQREALIWAFRELVDRHNGRPVFYQVSDRSLPLYIDLGLSLSKLGEDGRVSLDGFSLQGSRRAELRQAVNRATKHGAVFSVVPRAEVPAIVPELERVSDSWLAEKSASEKGFSLGSFSARYIENFDCAVVRTKEGIVAFANLWPAAASGELSIDMMRYDRRAPKSTMDYMFAELLQWAAAAGYAWFNVGMAPLSGMEQRQLAPLWHKLGHLLYTHGETFYNFEGLRSYKEKFDPVWRPRYLACPGGVFDLPWALIDSSRLISGGLARMLTR